MDNYFSVLNAINVSDKVEEKNGLSYLSWAWAWGELKKRFPDATYTIYENAAGMFYHTDGKTAWVKTGVTINGLEHIEYLPVMDMRNKSIPLENVTSFDVNKAIQRSLTKACARHGLGLYIYAGEDLPESEQTVVPTKDAIAEANLIRTQILALSDIDTINKFVEKLTKGKFNSLDGMNLEQLRFVKTSFLKVKNESK